MPLYIILGAVAIIAGAFGLLYAVELYSRYEGRKFDESLAPQYRLIQKRQAERETARLRALYWSPPQFLVPRQSRRRGKHGGVPVPQKFSHE